MTRPGSRADKSVRIVVLEESLEWAAIVAGLLERSGFRVGAVTTPSEALLAMSESAPERVLLLASSTLAMRLGPSFTDLLQHDPNPLLALTCTQPQECPHLPHHSCPETDCLRKPQDFAYPDLVNRLNRIMALR